MSVQTYKRRLVEFSFVPCPDGDCCRILSHLTFGHHLLRNAQLGLPLSDHGQLTVLWLPQDPRAWRYSNNPANVRDPGCLRDDFGEVLDTSSKRLEQDLRT